MAIGDKIDTHDALQTRLSPAPSPETLPEVMVGPCEHPCKRLILDLIRDWDHGGAKVSGLMRVPVYACSGCETVYRLTECQPIAR